ncbi:site-specific integrase [Clostridium botulinum]|nr:site-specific integrase [Clostridium botulinum]NFR13883.1 site-specific integrase [Clostridium botulinum]NFR42528.1 site-specific integrase [Clostridium botulinum]NFS49424.1 site-specific integrase [Clostridium botulinum]
MPKSIYRKRVINGTEYFFYRLRHDNLRKPKDLYARTEKELKAKIKKLNYELDHNIQSNKNSFGVFFSEWLFDIKFMEIKPSTKIKYETVYRNHIKNSEISDIKIKELTSKDIQIYYNNLIKKGKSTTLVRTIHKLISPCIKYAYNNDFIIKDFTGSLIIPKETEKDKLNKKSSVIPFTLEEQKEFIKAIKGNKFEVLFITALNSGLREGELLSITWNDINFKDKYINVSKNLGVVTEVSKDGRGASKLEVQTPKTKKGKRQVSIPNFLVSTLKEYKKKQVKNRLKLANKYTNNNLVFCDEYGNYLNRDKVTYQYKKLLKESKIKTRKFHDLRHTYATRLFELGEQARTVQELLGHSDVSVTLNTYTHVLDDMKEKAVSKLDNLFNAMGD